MSHNIWCLGYIEDFSGAMSLFLGHTGLFLLLFRYMSLFFRLTGLFPLLFLYMSLSLDSRDFLPCFFTYVPSRFCNSIK